MTDTKRSVKTERSQDYGAWCTDCYYSLEGDLVSRMEGLLKSHTIRKGHTIKAKYTVEKIYRPVNVEP